MELNFFNRQTQKVEKELVYGEKFVEWLYQSKSGDLLSGLLVKPPLSKLYGAIQNTQWSARKVKPFVEKFKIEMEDFLPQEGNDSTAPYDNFNQFFIRKLKPGKRPFSEEPLHFSAFSEARYFAYEKLDESAQYPVKGQFLSPRHLLGQDPHHDLGWAERFMGGSFMIARLCPVDYHRFHYPVDGKVVAHYRVPGLLHSVNPLALQIKPELLFKNERQVTIVETEKFGLLAYIEVGAIMVGKIAQTASMKTGTPFKKGDEKGYFLFGGSTVIVLSEPHKLAVDPDILTNTARGIETYIRLGDTIARGICS